MLNISYQKKLKSKSFYSLAQIQQLLSPVKIITKYSSFFPEGLKQLSDCPEILFVLGNEKIVNQFSISIVGTRNSCEDGNRIAYTLGKDLAQQNIIIVSGLASGIDTHSHSGAISSGNTIAILAYGFQWLSRKNISIAQKILDKGGAIISEYFPDVSPQKFSFLKRNRLIAAISMGVIIVEAPEKSGALHTAAIAKKLNKPIFVIPWNITTFRGIGSNILLQNSAILLTNASQVLDYFQNSTLWKNKFFPSVDKNEKTLHIPMPAKKITISISKEYQSLYNFILKHSPVSKDTLYTHFSAESISDINTKLVLMELENLIYQKNQSYYIS